MTIHEILQLPMAPMLVYVDELAAYYKELTGINVCRSCGSDLDRMIHFLKQNTMKTKYQLAKPFVIYKMEKGSSRTISNNVMSDELAQEFLQINPERIKLFSVYPEDWQTPCSDCDKRKELNEFTVKELVELYPGVSNDGLKKSEFIDAIIASEKTE